MNDCTTYPTKLVENLRKEIEELKAENKKLKDRISDYSWASEYMRSELDNYRRSEWT